MNSLSQGFGHLDRYLFVQILAAKIFCYDELSSFAAASVI